MNALISIVTFVLALVCFRIGFVKGHFAVYISLMMRGLRPELIAPIFLLTGGSYLLFLSYTYLPFSIVWKG